MTFDEDYENTIQTVIHHQEGNPEYQDNDGLAEHQKISGRYADRKGDKSSFNKGEGASVTGEENEDYLPDPHVYLESDEEEQKFGTKNNKRNPTSTNEGSKNTQHPL